MCYLTSHLQEWLEIRSGIFSSSSYSSSKAVPSFIDSLVNFYPLLYIYTYISLWETLSLK